MKKSQEISRKTWRMIAKNLIVLAVMAVVAFVGVSSWFSQNTKATADGIVAKTVVQDGLEFYVMPPSSSDQYAAINTRLANNAAWNAANPNETQKRTTWHTGDGAVTFDFTDQEFKFMEGLFLCEVTGDGTTFQIPKLMQFDQIAYVDTSQAFDSAVANDEYMSFDLYFRCENPKSVVLKSDSSITAATTYTGYTNPIHEPGEDYKNAAIGAVRMSVLNMEANGVSEVLWIPGPDVYYDGLNDDLYLGLSESAYGNKGTAYYNESTIALRQGEGTNDHAYYASPSSRQVISHSASGMHAGSTLGSDVTVVTLPTENHDTVNGYYYGHIRVNLWIEGEDAEARLNFVGGQFQMNLHFQVAENAS